MATARTRLITLLVHSTAKAHGCEADLEIRQGYPHVHNDVHLARASNRPPSHTSVPNVHDLDIRMTAEDFSYFANEIPAFPIGRGQPPLKKGTTTAPMGFTPPPSMWMKTH